MTTAEFVAVVTAHVEEGREAAVKEAESFFFSDKAAERFADEVGDFCRRVGVVEGA